MIKKQRNGFDMERLIGYVLLTGVALSAGLLLAGIGWIFVLTRHTDFNDALSSVNIWHFWNTIRLAFVHSHWTPILLVNGGIAALLFTPYLRVLVSLLYFMVIERNKKFVFFTAVVLAILTHSLFIR